jgi:hypothetical protein
LPAKNQVLGVEVDGKFNAYSFSDLTKAGKRLKDSFNGADYTIAFDSPNRSAKIVSSTKPIIYITTFWFAWYTFHLDTELFNADDY